MHCPKCGDSTREITLSPSITCPFCPGCGGVWLRKGMLARYCGLASDLPEFSITHPKAKQATQECPECHRAKLMTMRYASSDELLLDWCPRCEGLWFDQSELKRVRELAASLGEAYPIAHSAPSTSSPVGAAARKLELELEPDIRPMRSRFDPSSDSQRLEQLFDERHTLFVERQVGTAEVVVGVQASYDYNLWADGVKTIGRIRERESDVVKRLWLHLLSWDGLADLVVEDAWGSVLLNLVRRKPFLSLGSFVDVRGGGGVRLGRVERRFRWLTSHYVLIDERGRAFGSLVRPWWGVLRFEVRDAQGNHHGTVTKQWNGYFSHADNYELDLPKSTWSLSQRILILAAVIAVDFDRYRFHHRSVMSYFD